MQPQYGLRNKKRPVIIKWIPSETEVGRMAGKVTLLDGATGTRLWEKAGDRSPVWAYNITRPDIVRELHAEYIEAGSEIILTNTFCANAPMLKNTGFAVEEVVRAGVRIAKEAAFDKGVKVALDAGPLATRLAPTGGVSRDEAAEIFAAQLGAGMREKPDCIFLETFMDLEMISIALSQAKRHGVPVLCAMNFARSGKTPAGDTAVSIARRLEAEGAYAVGLNCSLGPDAALPIVRQFAQNTDLPLIFKPNAGLPDEGGSAPFDAQTFAAGIREAVKAGATLVGGCCGTDPSYIARLSEMRAEFC